MSTARKKQYVLIIQSSGDGESAYGTRWHSVRFNSKRAAEAAKAGINKLSGGATFIVVDEAEARS